jgi:hypothetical protein
MASMVLYLTIRRSWVSKKTGWQVRLGREEWSRYTYERAEGDGIELLGSVNRGMQAGALGLLADGQYVQINGDHITPLGGGQIRRALGKATASRQAQPYRRPVQQSNRPAPVVVIKKRRILSPSA